MTTSMDTIPAPSKANRCWHLCSFAESSTNSCFKQKDIECLFNQRSQGRCFWGWSGHSTMPSRTLPPSVSCLCHSSPSSVQDVCSCSRDQESTWGRGNGRASKLSSPVCRFPQEIKSFPRNPSLGFAFCFLHQNWIPWPP